MLRAFLILSILTVIVSAQSSFGKGYRTIIHSSFPIDAPLHFDPGNDERLVLSIDKPSSDAFLKTDDKHRIRIINIDHKLAQKDLNSKKAQVSVSVKQNESPKAILPKHPVIDYGLPRINLKDDDSNFAPSPETKYISQKLSLSPKDSRLFVSKIPSAEELLEKGYVLTDIYPLEFSSDGSDFELRPPEDSSRKYKFELIPSLSQNKSEPQTVFESKISSIKTDEATDAAARPLEVKYNFLPRSNQAEFNLGKKYISKFLRPAVAYEIPETEGGSGGIIKNKQGIRTQRPKQGAETNSFVSSKSEAAGSNTKEIPQIKYALPSNDKDKKDFITSVFGDYSAESEGLRSRLTSSKSGNLQNEEATANERGALNNRVKGKSGIETQQSGLFSSGSKNSNENINTKTPIFQEELKKYLLPSPSNGGSVFSSKLGEASEAKSVTSSFSAISNFGKQSTVKTEKVFESQLAKDETETESRNSGDVTKPEEFAIYYKTPDRLESKYEIPKSYEPFKKSFWYTAVPKSHPEQSQTNSNLPFEVPNESEESVAPFNTRPEKSTADVKSLEDFLKPEKFAIYYKTPLTQSGERPVEHTQDEVQFLGITSTPTSSHEVFEANLKIPTDVYGVPYVLSVVQSNLPGSAEYEMPTVNSDTIQAFGGNSEKVYQPVSGVTPPSTSYGTPLLSLSSSVDIKKEITPFAEYSLPIGKPSGSAEDNQHPDSDIRTVPNSHFIVSKPSLEYGIPNLASSSTNDDVRKPAEHLIQMKQKTYEFGVPALKVPNTRPLSSYEVPVY